MHVLKVILSIKIFFYLIKYSFVKKGGEGRNVVQIREYNKANGHDLILG